MKSLFYYLKAGASLLLFAAHTSGQLYIDITTGRNNNTYLPIPHGQSDDTWKVGLSPTPSPPGNSALTSIPVSPPGFQWCKIGNGSALSPCGNTPLISFGSEWMSRSANSSGQHLAVPGGIYVYQTLFSLSDCECWESSTCDNLISRIKYVRVIMDLRLNGTSVNGTDDAIRAAFVLINGKQYVPNILYGTNAHLKSNTPYKVYEYIVPREEVNLDCTPNRLEIIVDQVACGSPPSGASAISVKGNIEFVTGNDLKNVEGNIAEGFCIEEDVYLDASNTPVQGIAINTQTLELYHYNANIPALVTTIFNLGSVPGWINVTKLVTASLGYNYFSTNPGLYKLVLKIKSRCDSEKVLTTVRNFNIYCCPNSADASFEFLSSPIDLVAGSIIPGNHEWVLYSSPTLSGDYGVPLVSFVESDFHWPKSPGSNKCFYVKHSVSNACGADCEAMRICNENCGDFDCYVTTPINIMYDPNTMVLSWDQVVGAANYKVDITVNGCCGQQAISSVNFHSFTVSSNNLNVFLSSLTPGTYHYCYLITVYAVCNDGTFSQPGVWCLQMPQNRISTGAAVSSESTELILFPNPSGGLVYVRTDSQSSLITAIRAVDGLGRIVIERQLESDKQALVPIILPGKGLFLVQLISAGTPIGQKRVVIE